MDSNNNKTVDDKTIYGLAVQQSEKEALSIEQVTFNTLLDRMKKAELKIEAEKASLDILLSECVSKVYPVHQEVIRLDFQVINELYTYFNATSFSAIRRRAFIDFLSEMIDNILFSPHGLNNEESEKIISIHEEINKSSTKKSKKSEAMAKEFEFEMLISDLKLDLFVKGFNIDLSDLTIDMSEEEINLRIEEKIKNYSESNSNPFSTKKESKKTKKQLEKEAKEKEIEELKGKSISSIYKSLAKILHPDLEQNEEKKLQKEEWMKKLTVAYEKKDLKTLLEIELEWAKGETDRIQSLSRDKLNLYNEMLRSQVQEMELQAATVYNDNKYILLAFFAGGLFNLKRWRPSFSIKHLQQKKRNSEIILEILEKQDLNTKKLVDKVIKDHQRGMGY